MNKEYNIEWLNNFINKTINFVNNMSDHNYRYFKYSLTGDFYNSHEKWGLGQIVFAVKILYMLNKLKELNNLAKSNIITSIKRFERPNLYIYDPLISKLTFKKRLINFVKKPSLISFSNEEIKRAETRQALAALLCLEAKPDKPFLHIPYNREEVDIYLRKLDWSNPWHAGSHLSHLLFFYNSNKVLFDYQVKLTDNLINYSIDWVNKLQSKTDGTWYQGNVPLNLKINGAMKILTGFAAVDFYSINFVYQLIDNCLLGINDSHACDNFNIVYVLYFCSKITNYKKDEIEKFLKDRLDIYKQYYHAELGGFSFYKKRANDYYYNAKITKGLNEPDIHGTVMFTWGISLISQVIDIGFKLKIPIT